MLEGKGMEPLDKGYCLVLSGGGAKGVYHIGVWRALKELGIEVKAVLGASIGAIIAGFLAQGEDEALEEIGRSISLDSILALPEEFTENGKIKVDKDSFSAAREFFLSLVGNKGLDTSPLREILMTRLDEEAIRKSRRDLGIVTVNLSDLQPREVFIEEMDKGKLVDYLMASAAFPGFQQPIIAGKKYVDGGIYDNIPYAMARQRGYRRVIISDISGAGRNRKPEIEGSITIYVKNSIDMGGVLDFDRRFLDDFTILGYLDTMRTFGHFQGYNYFIEPNQEAENSFSVSKKNTSGIAPKFPEVMRYDRRLLLKYLECAASILQIERVRAYNYNELTLAIDRKQKADETKVANLLQEGKNKRMAIVAMLRETIANRSFEASPYYYWRLIEEFMPKSAGAVLKRALVGLFSELPAGLFYLGH